MFCLAEKLRALFESVEVEEVERYLLAFHNISSGGEGSGPIGKLDAVSRFRWLTAWRSTMIQTSRVHPGFCTDAEKELDRLFAELVMWAFSVGFTTTVTFYDAAYCLKLILK